jgi:methyltransferase FkbM-like protein
MEGLLAGTEFSALVARCDAIESFTLIDVGCSSGIDQAWRVFGDRLVAFGFDPNLTECARLQEEETLKNVRYVPVFVGVPADLPYVRERARRGPWSRNLWPRLSVHRSLELLQSGRDLTDEEKTQTNLWRKIALADSARPVFLHEYLPAHGVSDVDVLKIDVDGVDFGILNSVASELADWRVLAVGLEVNFFGSDDPTDHTLHAMDRFMRAQGFDLFDLTVRRYSHMALPAPYVFDVPAQSVTGRPLQGDALYLRDLCAAGAPRGYGPVKLLKLAAIASLAGLADSAAEVLVRHRDTLAPLIDVDRSLDLLAAQVQPDATTPLSYTEYIAAFERNDRMFYSATGLSVADLKREIADLKREAAAICATSEALQREMAALRGSRSWRLTAPLRTLMRALRGG